MEAPEFTLALVGKVTAVLWALSSIMMLTVVFGNWVAKTILFALLSGGCLFLWSQIDSDFSRTRWGYCGLAIAALSLVVRQLGQTKSGLSGGVDVPSATVCVLATLGSIWAVASVAPHQPTGMSGLIALNFGGIALSLAVACAIGIISSNYIVPTRELSSSAEKDDGALALERLVTRGVKWCRFIGFFAFGLQVIVSMNVFFGDGPTDLLTETERRPEYLMLAWLYCVTLLTLTGSVAYIPGRFLATRKTLTVRDWTTLKLASWICAFALGVAVYLPLHWPWAVGSVLGPAVSLAVPFSQ